MSYYTGDEIVWDCDCPECTEMQDNYHENNGCLKDCPCEEGPEDHDCKSGCPCGGQDDVPPNELSYNGDW